jgi:hypothetical protein
MRFLKKFESFINEEAEPKTAPSKPATSPEPGIKEPGTKPTPRPNRPSPIRRDRPAVTPKPKLVKATEEDIIEKFATLTNQK